MEKDNTDITIDTYDNIVNEYIDYFKSKDLKGKVQFQREIDLMVSKLSDNALILDAGTAMGDYPKYLTEKLNKNFKVIGIDASKNMIEKAKSNATKAQFKVMDIRNLEFDNEMFDAIICFATLIHINDSDCLKVLDKFDAITKDNGLIIINVMEQNDDKKEFMIDEPFNPKYKTYFNKYTKNFFIEYFKSKGYEILGMFDNPLFNTE